MPGATCAQEKQQASAVNAVSAWQVKKGPSWTGPCARHHQGQNDSPGTFPQIDFPIDQ